MRAAWSPELRPGSSPPATSRRARFWEVPQKGQHPHPRRGSGRHTAAGTATSHTPGGAAHSPQEGQRRHAPQAGQRQLTPQEGQQTRTHRQGGCPFCRVCLQPYACVRRHLATARSGPRAVRRRTVRRRRDSKEEVEGYEGGGFEGGGVRRRRRGRGFEGGGQHYSKTHFGSPNEVVTALLQTTPNYSKTHFGSPGTPWTALRNCGTRALRLPTTTLPQRTRADRE